MGGGDGGLTEFRGERVPKDDERIEVLGQFDELQAALALAACADPREDVAGELRTAVAEAARALEAIAGYPSSRPFPPEAVERLDRACADLENGRTSNGLVLPGADEDSARLNLCRTVARRAERALVAASRAVGADPSLLSWSNRLSWWLFLASTRSSGGG